LYWELSGGLFLSLWLNLQANSTSTSSAPGVPIHSAPGVASLPVLELAAPSGSPFAIPAVSSAGAARQVIFFYPTGTFVFRVNHDLGWSVQ
jgi:hypothetical protein